jgi:hypothetical protein
MRNYRWLTLGAALVIIALEAWLFTSASAVATQADLPTAAVATQSAIVPAAR